MARYIILPSRLPKNYKSTWRHKLSYQVDLTKNYVVMAKYIILPSRLPKKYMSSWRHNLSYQVDLPSRLNKNTCRHGDIYYPDKSTSEKQYVVMARYIILPSRLFPLLGGGGVEGKTPKCTDKLPTHRLMQIYGSFKGIG